MGVNLNVKGISIKLLNLILIIIGIVISITLFISVIFLSNGYKELQISTKNYVIWKDKANDVIVASDYLTDQARGYVISEKEEFMFNYIDEVKNKKRRENALEFIKQINNTDAYTDLEVAVNNSFSLSDVEYYAMRLIAKKNNVDITAYPKEIQDVVLSIEDESLTGEELRDKAIDLLFDVNYFNKKEIIIGNAEKVINDLNVMFEEHLSLTSNNLSSLVLFQNIMICTLTIYIVIIFFFIYLAFVKPVNYAVIQIINGRLISAKGVKEYKYLAEAYNMMCERNIISKSKILFEAEHDKLTGFYNRNGYTTIFESINLSKTIYILIDVDLFKEINDSYGHNIGDKALIKVANVIKKQFEKCYLCRIGGDEFVVLAVNCNFDENTLITKIKNMNSELSFKDDSIPAISLSVGVAYGNKYDTTSSIFKKADEALYDVKKSGRCGISIYNDNNN